MSQNPTVSYLPAQLLGPDYANRTIQLYYTGITRLAKGILQEIVEDMLRSRSSTLRTLSYVRSNALHLYHALQQSALEAVQQCIARSWQLNKQLDEGTSTPDIERIIALCGEDAAACKLLGAGGGGYMLIFAKDPTAGERIRTRLKANPPNSRSRFIDFQVAERALEVTVS